MRTVLNYLLLMTLVVATLAAFVAGGFLLSPSAEDVEREECRRNHGGIMSTVDGEWLCVPF
jgi:uncharacterized protein involved in cysteine biosynthesis